MMSDKIRPHHLDRRAILYVRQSSSYQVLHNRESRALQYAMRDRLVALGWSEIEIIDDDLGARLPAASCAPASSGWWQKSALERWVGLPLGRSPDSQQPRLAAVD